MTVAGKQCLILAAGNGQRLRSRYANIPKPLVPLRGIPLIEHVLLGAQEAGVTRFVIVTGYKGEMIRGWFAQRGLQDVDITWVENPDYHKANGLSVWKARHHLHDSFLLLMSDHLFQPNTARRLIRQPLGPGEVILAVDHHINRVFDLDDATKVRLEGSCIVDIGKEINQYDALDTGMFWCSPALFGALESAMKNGDCSLSDGMRKLSERWKFRGFNIGDARWQDVDTPEALAHAENTFDHHFYRPDRTARLACA